MVLNRQVDPGQTVAASFQTPVLFTLARDLSQMTLTVNVDEADIGRVRKGQDASFTVDAYPERVFVSRVLDVRNIPETVSGVVTYETVLSVDNAELLLRPGMTATATIAVTRVEDALLVPNAALRFVPAESDQAAADDESRGLVGALLPRPGRFTMSTPAHDATPAVRQIWVLDGGEPVPVSVTLGATDGTMTEIVEGDLPADTPVIVGASTVG